MEEITVHYNNEAIYPIILTDSFDKLGEELDRIGLKDSKICVVTDSNVGPCYLNEVMNICSAHCSRATSFTFDAGEKSKNMDTVQELYEHLVLCGFERRDVLAALGGGVTGDLTGFAASTYMRGIRFIQIPVSLVAQVDSSIGGKTGVDFKNYKNMVGAFWQPSLVYTNTRTLQTLPRREYVSGMGEVIKHGLIRDRDYYMWLKSNRNAILDRDVSVITYMVGCSCRIKQSVVENDPKETGERAVLNFGHTIGHAVEKIKNFTMLHGECVSVGICAAARLSADRGLISEEECEDIADTLRSFGLPVSVSGTNAADIVKTTRADKKMDRGHVRFVVLDGIGHAVTDSSVSEDDLMKAACSITGGPAGGEDR